MPASSYEELRSAFVSPPNSAKPRVWWHWMNGNITLEGIRADLYWMKRVGLGGAHIFDASMNTPVIIPERRTYMSSSWADALRCAVQCADELDLEIGVAGSPGWSESGGPWVSPENGMKKVVWSEMSLAGGQNYRGPLPCPPHTVGPFRNVPADWTNPVLGAPPLCAIPDFYRDIAIVAVRRPDDDYSMEELKPRVTSTAGPFDAERLWDRDLTTVVSLPFGDLSKPAWIEFGFSQPRTIYAVSLALQRKAGLDSFVDPARSAAELQATDDGIEYRTVATLHDTADLQQTIAFSPATARRFRLLLATPKIPASVAALIGQLPNEHRIAQLILHTAPRIDHYEQKAGYFVDGDADRYGHSSLSAGVAARADEIFDLTQHFQADGVLDWTPPDSGAWRILRFGYSLLGRTHRAAPTDSVGLEVDKLSRSAVRSHMDSYLGGLRAALGCELVGHRGLSAMVNDSWVVGPQNWTDDLPSEFKRRRGYSLVPWLPTLTGRVVGDTQLSDRFLWDFRRTLGELVAENHYGEIADCLHRQGMIHYNESHERSRRLIADGMDTKRFDDVPMGAMWVGDFRPQHPYDADLRESASVAHIYGQNLVGAESFTAYGTAGPAYAWVFAPENLKATADREFAHGVNRIVIHSSPHQPFLDGGPGITLGPFGQWFTRHETWAEQAGPWITYLARSSYLLQQGQFVADVLYYYGQDSNITALYANKLPPIPEGYAFDFASAHALKRLFVRDGNIATDCGGQYRLLVIDPRVKRMSLDVLKTFVQLVRDGATVLGEKPESSPSLTDEVDAFRALTNALWRDGTQGVHTCGKGHVMNGLSIQEALTRCHQPPDFICTKSGPESCIWFLHRRLSNGGDIYFVNNRRDYAETFEASFRVSGSIPELWCADTGVIAPAPYRIEKDRTYVPLDLEPQGAVFIVFLNKASQPRRQIVPPGRNRISEVTGPWRVRFQAGRGAPDQATFTELVSWTSHTDIGIRYFSGTATYEATLVAEDAWLESGQRIELDLGMVRNLAEVFVNDRSAGIVWKQPFRVDITEHLRPGRNRLGVSVTNLWPNALIGSQQPNPLFRPFTTFNPYKADSPLLESGLLGPVILSQVCEA